MEYLKFNIDEMNQKMLFCQYRDLSQGKHSPPMIQRAFPLEKILEAAPELLKLTEGEEIGMYYENKGQLEISERIFITHRDPLDSETIDFIKTFITRACIDEEFDELLKPPTVDQQVEDFIKEFFENEEEEPLEQKDFLAEFFAELEEETETKE
tara:strand:- start:522 stop:983 length:462 start_codon:yes stop_codon:yes gene_type:complete